METNEQPTEQSKKKHPRRGFASMSPDRRREIASLGGHCAHACGRAQTWSSEEAQAAGRKGGTKSRRSKLSNQEYAALRSRIAGPIEDGE
jgi:general stress protein YciG